MDEGPLGLPAPNSVPFCRYYSDIRQSPPASYQEMNSALTELSGVRRQGKGEAGGSRSGLGPHPPCAAPRITLRLPTACKLCKNSTPTSTGTMTR